MPRSKCIKNVSRETSGSVSLLFAMIALLLFSFIGAAVDYSRWNNARSRTADALDAALLTAGRALQTARASDEAIAIAEKTFLENAKTRLNLVSPKVSVRIAPDGTALEASASGKLKTPFMGLLRVGALNVEATSRVGFSFGSGGGGSDLEISIMLDVTGSMCNDGSGPCTSSAKMDALKASAADLINIVMKGGSSGANVRVALVPFATRIVVGPALDGPTEALMEKLTDMPSKWTGWMKDWTNCGAWTPGATSEDPGSSSGCTTWTANHYNNLSISPCITDRTGPDEFTDAAPGPNSWLNAQAGNRDPLSWDSSDTPINAGDGTGQTAADPSQQWNYLADAWCWDVDPANVIMPLTADKDALLQRINSLVGYGGTSGALGTAWAWYTLSPNWSTIFNGQSAAGSYADTAPAGSNPPKLRKIAVLMTDGVYNAYRGWLGQDANMVSTNAKQICANMKAQGIEIYTIGFDLDALQPADKARAMDTLQSCGTDIHHFYDALNTEQLKQSFRDIAMQLSQLYIAR